MTDEWDERVVKKGLEYAILTDKITKAWSGKTTGEYKEFKGLKTVDGHQNLEPFKPIEADDYIVYLKNNPDEWHEVFRTIAENNIVKPHNAVLGFIKEYIIKHSTSELPQGCLTAIANFAWECPPEDIVTASEIRRKLP